jgi:hypothetical protein
MKGRQKRQLGDIFVLKNFGQPDTVGSWRRVVANASAQSAGRDRIYPGGAPTLVTDQGEVELPSGMCAGFQLGA